MGGAPAGLRLLFTFQVPHYGFCPVASTVVVDEEGRYSTLLVLPGESRNSGENGIVTAWKLSASSSASSSSERRAAAHCQGKAEEEEEDYDAAGETVVNTAGMSPMDALFARSKAREEALEKRRQRCSRLRSGDGGRQGAGGGGGAPQLLFAARSIQESGEGKRSGDNRRTGWANPLAASFSGALSVLPADFSVKSGVVMRMDVQTERRESSPALRCSSSSSSPTVILSTSFESGHITVSRLSFPSSSPDEELQGGNVFLRCEVLAAVRAFPESAMSCVWRWTEQGNATGDYVVATSAEGNVQCFHALWTANPSGSSSSSPPVTVLSLVPCWSTSLPKGIGSVCVVGSLLVLGCWDGTLRLYDLRGRQRQKGASSPPLPEQPEGEQPHGSDEGVEEPSFREEERSPALVSILPFHVPSAVNEVTALPLPSLGALATFAFDPRMPKLYAAEWGGVHRAGRTVDGHPPSALESPAATSTSSPTSAVTLATRPSPVSHAVASSACTSSATRGVHVFASASKDGCITLWRVDFAGLSEARLLLLPSGP